MRYVVLVTRRRLAPKETVQGILHPLHITLLLLFVCAGFWDAEVW